MIFNGLTHFYHEKSGTLLWLNSYRKLHFNQAKKEKGKIIVFWFRKRNLNSVI